MLIAEARAAAAAWVGTYADTDPDFRGAFFSGSVVSLPDTAPVPDGSDVDIVLVRSGPAAPKIGKFWYAGALLDVSFLALADLADADRVARTYQLAASFCGDTIIRDPIGRLSLLRDAIAPSFADPQRVLVRCQDAVAKLTGGLNTDHRRAPWHEQITAWMFPTSITTHVILVAALRNPTVRLRYLAARSALAEHSDQQTYPVLLGLLGCQDVERDVVQHHLDALGSAFDRAAEIARTPFFFSADIRRQTRAVAIDGSQRLVDDGDHREAVFWIVATYSRVQQIFDHDGSPELRRSGARRFAEAVSDLLGIDRSEQLEQRRGEVFGALPTLLLAATAIAARDGGSLDRSPPRSACGEAEHQQPQTRPDDAGPEPHQITVLSQRRPTQ